MVPKDGVGKGIDLASMKALPKRKGNAPVMSAATKKPVGLNESPSKKEGKSGETQPAGNG